MEDLAHFIQSMSEKYGLLDASHKQQQHQREGNDKQNHLFLQDVASSAASNTINSGDEYQASSWECLSVFISGSQSQPTDCKPLPPSGSHHHDFSSLLHPTGPKTQTPVAGPASSPSTSVQQQIQQNSDSSLHSFSKLIDIEEEGEEVSPSHHNAARHHIKYAEPDSLLRNDYSSSFPNEVSSSPAADAAAPTRHNELVERKGNIFDCNGELSTVVSMSDYVQQDYFPVDGQPSCEPGESSSGAPLSRTLTTGQTQIQHSERRLCAIISSSRSSSCCGSSRGDCEVLLQKSHSATHENSSRRLSANDSNSSIEQQNQSHRGNNGKQVGEGGQGPPLPAMNTTEMLPTPITMGWEDKSAIGQQPQQEHKPEVHGRSACGQLQQEERSDKRAGSERASVTRVSLDNEVEFADFNASISEDYDSLNGKTNGETWTGSGGSGTDGAGTGSKEDPQTAHFRMETKKLDEEIKRLGGGISATRRQLHLAKSMDSQSSTESPSRPLEAVHEAVPSENNPQIEYQQQQKCRGRGQGQGQEQELGQGKCEEPSASPAVSEYLPVSTAMQSRVTKLDEASKALFTAAAAAAAAGSNYHRDGKQSNQNLFEKEREEEKEEADALPQTSSSDAPVHKKARSLVVDTAYDAEHEKDEDDSKENGRRQFDVSTKRDRATSPTKRIGRSVGGKRPAGLRKISKYLVEDANFQDSTWEMDEYLNFPDWRQAVEAGAEAGEETGAERENGRRGGGGGRRSRDEEGERKQFQNPKWSHVNVMLCECGFSPLDSRLLLSSETSDSILCILDDVLLKYGRREKVIQEVLEEREVMRLEEMHSSELVQKLESETDALKRKLKISEQRAEVANVAAKKNFAALRQDKQRLEASNASMLQRCSQLEHAFRAKERAICKLQEKIQEAVEREERQRCKEKEVYEKLKRKNASRQKAQGEVIESNFLLRDLKPATIVGIYERQRAAVEAELTTLRDENSRLCQELLEMENSPIRKTTGMSTADVARSGLNKRERVLSQQLTEIDKLLTTKSSGGVKGASERNHAILSLEPVDQKGDLKKDITNLKVQPQAQPCAEEQTLPLSFFQRLQGGNGCTSTACQEFKQDVCSRLKITDPARTIDAIDGLLRVVAAVPLMETFVEEVCNTVFSDDEILHLTKESSGEIQQTPESVPRILKSWMEQLHSLDELREFKESIATQLWERFDEKAVKHPMSSRVAAESVRDLIDVERQYLLSQASYRDGGMILKAEPQKLLHRIISHFQMLFEIPRLEGVMAVMNSVYIQISEYHNFARALCSMLGLPKDARPNSIISTITSVLNKG